MRRKNVPETSEQIKITKSISDTSDVWKHSGRWFYLKNENWTGAVFLYFTIYLEIIYIYIFKKILAPVCHGRGFEHRPAKAFANPDDFQGHKIFQCRYTVKS